ncbi:histidine kinase [Aquimarina sp. MAR_2010_214]|uniref:sensor histidine kinase n=1 Tax=Aquimarina sp. MAR_2010_214 TaxID=1250026 RepID=UPI000CC667FC|nr:sensor histidine kinase [Aquimarina sp. MAR_2010_214]PKV51075.1 histidine kinase [Aquimarina sp. MAR_2010_214]
MNFKKLKEDFRQSRLSFHIIFWLVVLLFFMVRDDFEENHTMVASLVYKICIMIPQILASYSLTYILVPKFIYTKKYVRFTILMLLSAYIFSALSRVLIVHVAEPLVRIPPFTQETVAQIFLDVKFLMAHYFPSIYIAALIFLAVQFIVDISKVKQQNLLLEKEKVGAELKMLKTQLHPHFLFNTLNNIYMLSLDNSPKTPESISKLSEILDYVLYRCNTKFVSVTNEISFLENYIALEKLRYDDRLQVTFNTSLEKDIEIAPLILLPLVENAFKHGAGEDSGSPKIDISISYQDTIFTFVVANSIANSTQEGVKESIGLNNIKQQLDLIYPNGYILNIDEKESLFTVTLELTV